MIHEYIRCIPSPPPLISTHVHQINEDLREMADDLYGACQPGHLVVCDLTDPLLSALDVNGIFQVECSGG